MTDMGKTPILHYSEIYNMTSKLCRLPESLILFIPLSMATSAQQLPDMHLLIFFLNVIHALHYP